MYSKQYKTFCLLQFLFLALVRSIKECPTNKDDWNKKEGQYKCKQDEKYHCGILLSGALHEFCFERSALSPKVCPRFDLFVRKDVTTVECNKAGCPVEPYLTDELYKYPMCFTNSTELTKTRHLNNEETTTTAFSFDSTATNSSNNASTVGTFTSQQEFQNIQKRQDVVEFWNFSRILTVGSITFLLIFTLLTITACILFKRTKDNAGKLSNYTTDTNSDNEYYTIEMI